jgi:hypothetical protein
MTKYFTLIKDGQEINLRYINQSWQWELTKDNWKTIPGLTDSQIENQIYENYLLQVESLMDASTPEDLAKLNELTNWIVEYEKIHYPVN